MTENADGSTATAAKPAREPRAPRPKEGKCHHCGATTKGGQFVAGHDAKLKGELQRIAADPAKSDKERVAAVAEQLARGWHKHPVPQGLFKHAKGANDEEKSTARNQLEEKYVALRTQAEQVVETQGKDKVIEKAAAKRQPAAA